MGDLSVASFTPYIKDLGIDIAKVKNVKEVKAGSDVDVKLQALKNQGSEVIVKGNDGKYYFIEMQEDTSLMKDLQTKLKQKSPDFEVLGVNFVQKGETAGSLFSMPTVKSGKSALDNALEPSVKFDKVKDTVADGSFSLSILDSNGITQGGKDDIKARAVGNLDMSPPQLEKYINEGLLGKGSSFNVKVAISGGNLKLSVALSPEMKDAIRSKFLGGNAEILAKAADIDLKGKVEGIISLIESKLNTSLSSAELTKLFSGGIDAKSSIIDKITGLTSLTQKDFRDALDTKYVPSIATNKIADALKDEYDDLMKSAKAELTKRTTSDPSSKSSFGEMAKELYRVAGYTTSGSGLSQLAPSITANIGTDDKVHLNVQVDAVLSSDEAKGAASGKSDSVTVQGKFRLSTNLDFALDRADTNIDADIDTSKMSDAQKVALAEVIGKGGDRVNEIISTGKVNASIKATTTTISNDETDIKNNKTTANVQANVTEVDYKKYGTNIKGASASFDAEIINDEKTDKTKEIKITTKDKATVKEARLLSNFDIPDKNIKVKSFDLIGDYRVDKDKLKAAGIPDNIIPGLVANAGSSGVMYTKQSLDKLANMVLTAQKVEKGPEFDALKAKIIETSFRPPQLGESETTINLQTNEVQFKGKDIKSGINFSGNVKGVDTKVLVKDLSVTKAEVKVNLDTAAFFAKGDNIKLSGIDATYGNTRVTPNYIRITSGSVNLDPKAETASISGKSIIMGTPKPKELSALKSSIYVQDGDAKVNFGKSLSAEAKGTNIKLDEFYAGGAVTSLDAKGTSEVKLKQSGDNYDINIKGSKDGFSGKTKYKDKELEFSGNLGEVNISAKADASKVSFKASGEGSSFKLKSKEYDLDIDFAVPSGVTVELDLKTKSIKLSGADGKEFQAGFNIKDYAGNAKADINLKAKGEVNASFKDSKIDVTPPEGGVEVTANVIAGKDSRKITATVDNNAQLSVDLKDNIKIEAGKDGATTNLTVKSVRAYTGAVEADLQIGVNGKTGLNIKSGDDSTSVSFMPPASTDTKAGVTVKGKVDTGSGILDIKDLGISNKDSGGTVSISDNGINFSGAEVTAKGKVAFTEPNGTIPINLDIDGKAGIASASFNKKVIEAKAKFDINVKGDKGKYSGDGKLSADLGLKADLNKSEYQTAGKFSTSAKVNGSYLSLAGDISASVKKDEITVNAKTKIGVQTGVDQKANFLCEAENVKINLDAKDNNIISGKIKIRSADDKANPDGKLETEVEVKVEKTKDGYQVRLNGNLKSDDAMKAVLSQMDSIIKQKLIADELKKRDISTDAFDSILKSEGYKLIKSGDLKVTAGATVDLVNISGGVAVKNIKFNANVDKISASLPVLTYSKDRGKFGLDSKKANMTEFKDVLNISGSAALSDDKKTTNADVKLDIGKLMTQFMKQQFSDADSPVKIDDLKFEVKGNRVHIAVKDKQTDVSFGLEDIKMSIKDGSKIKVDIGVNVGMAIGDALGNAGFVWDAKKLFKDKDLSKADPSFKAFQTKPDESKALSTPGFGQFLGAMFGNDLTVTFDVAQVMKEYGKEYKEDNNPNYKFFDKLTLNGPITLVDGKMNIPISKETERRQIHK